ncbi:hypothetical protein [Natrinema hispanicum]|uniref:Uncharacterized protein n=1 Tax=Natrinema hispanicum TaxID=392421 RepID=A0A1G6YE44_9EURY|nr:hypothetical protein [Natrinema hispanicum]SDD87846.1 hypothetical protein SAMN05192552_10637 [Natrinema hispanicum]
MNCPGLARNRSRTGRFESLLDALLTAEEDECIEVTRDCWTCGWHEACQVRLESIKMSEGDEINDDLAAVDSLTTLEAVRAEIRRQ